MQLKLGIISFLFFLGFAHAYCQGQHERNSMSILLVKKNSPFTKISYDEDSTSVLIKIELKGMETEKKRKKAIKKSRRKGLPFPQFYFTL